MPTQKMFSAMSGKDKIPDTIKHYSRVWKNTTRHVKEKRKDETVIISGRYDLLPGKMNKINWKISLRAKSS